MRYVQTALSSIDSYKLGHPDMWPVGVTHAYSNFTPRSMEYLNLPEEYKKDKKIVWVGFQLFLNNLVWLWDETFFKLPKEEVIREFAELAGPFTGPRGFNVTRLSELHDLGYLPLRIKSLPEGSRVNIGVPCVTITNTHPRFGWFPNHLESWMSNESWKSPTAATIAYAYRQIIEKYAELTGGDKAFIDFQGHDFSYRGLSGGYDAAATGVGHQASFIGTDNIPAVKAIRDCYDGRSTFVGASVPASEHSVTCASILSVSCDDGTPIDERLALGEYEFFRRMITEVYPSGVVSLVSDSFDYWNTLTVIAPSLEEEILNRVPDELGLAKVVFRPDSGNPEDIICGTELECGDDATPEMLGSVRVLWNIFGGTINDKGYKTLNPRVGLIYGDSITPVRAESILRKLESMGFASDNLVLGIGSFTYEFNTRDTLGFAMKCTHITNDGKGISIYKNPKTDNGTKKSAKGLLRVDYVDGNFVRVDDVTPEEEEKGCLRVTFEDGKFYNETNIKEIRDILKSQ